DPRRRHVRSPLRAPRTISPLPFHVIAWSATTARSRDMPGASNAGVLCLTGKPPARSDSRLHPSRAPSLTDRHLGLTHMSDLFDCIPPLHPTKEAMAQGAVLLRGAALAFEKELLAAINDITATSPFRHMLTPGGFTMSVATTNCGAVGWVTDRTGYR